MPPEQSVELERAIENTNVESKEIEKMFFNRLNHVPKSVSMSNVCIKSFDIYVEEHKISKCFSYTNLSQSSVETHQKKLNHLNIQNNPSQYYLI